MCRRRTVVVLLHRRHVLVEAPRSMGTAVVERTAPAQDGVDRRRGNAPPARSTARRPLAAVAAAGAAAHLGNGHGGLRACGCWSSWRPPPSPSTRSGNVSKFATALDPGTRSVILSLFHWDSREIPAGCCARVRRRRPGPGRLLPAVPVDGALAARASSGVSYAHAALAISWTATYLLAVAVCYFARNCLGFRKLVATWRCCCCGPLVPSSSFPATPNPAKPCCSPWC